ncbi:hypothetical protein ALQ38_05580 [Pseudomonas marginalis pv. marginalis]|nr:hypothetical protein ALQ38_05580 [Pseudomonas marginalis pv. marginalis]
MRFQPRPDHLIRQPLEPLACSARLDMTYHLGTQAHRHTHRPHDPCEQQADQHLAGDFPHHLVHFWRRQHPYPTGYRRQVNKHQRLIAEHQQAVGNRVFAEFQQFIQFGLGDVLQQLLTVGLDIRQQVAQLGEIVPNVVKRLTHSVKKRVLQHPALIKRGGVCVVLPLGLEGTFPLFAQAYFQRVNHRLIRRIQRLDVILGNIGIEVDPVALVALTLVNFENAAGADGLMDGVAQRATLGVDALQHHWRIANGHESNALEHVHQGQLAIGLARSDGAAWVKRAVDRRDQRHFIPDLEDLLDIQRRKAPEARSPVIKGVQALPEIAKDALDIDRLHIHWGQGQPANGRVQETAPTTRKSICNPSHCVIRRGTLRTFSGEGSRAYPAVTWEVSTTFVFSRPSTRLHSAGKNNSVNTVPTSTPPIST